MNWPAAYRNLAVLFVDDEEMARKYFSRAFAERLRVFTAGSVAEAKELLASTEAEVAVLVTDQRMPGGNGVELLKHARAHHPQVVRLLTTAYSDLDEAIEAVNRGEIFRYITKPWDVDLLQAELGQALELYWLRRERELLLAEKLAVRQGLALLGRARDLLVMAAALPHLRHAGAAMGACLEDAAAAPRPAPVEGWQDTVAEIESSLALVARVLEASRGGETLTESVDLAGLLGGGDAIELRGSGTLLRRLVERLRALGAVRGEAMAGGGALLQADIPPTCPVLGGFLAGQPETAGRQAWADWISVYLLAYHHGGSVQAHWRPDGGAQLVLRLPANAAEAVPATATDPDLDRLLSRLELSS